MQKFHREKSGFTLVEILIVVAILGILVAVVAVSVVGMLGRGQKESYATDVRTIQTVVAAFYSDTHVYSNPNGWNESGNSTSVHNQPIGNPTDSTILDLYLGAVVDLNGYQVSIVLDGDGSEATTNDVIAAAIWMGLLTNGPGYGFPGLLDVAPGDANSPLGGENGPYLNPLPNSCSPYNSSKATGTYTWIVGAYGKVYGVSPYDYDNDSIDEWFAGFDGRYP